MIWAKIWNNYMFAQVSKEDLCVPISNVWQRKVEISKKTPPQNNFKKHCRMISRGDIIFYYLKFSIWIQDKTTNSGNLCYRSMSVQLTVKSNWYSPIMQLFLNKVCYLITIYNWSKFTRELHICLFHDLLLLKSKNDLVT